MLVKFHRMPPAPCSDARVVDVATFERRANRACQTLDAATAPGSVSHPCRLAQDTNEMSVSESRQHVAKQFELTDAQVRQIEDEGIEKEWPPLNEAVQTIG